MTKPITGKFVAEAVFHNFQIVDPGYGYNGIVFHDPVENGDIFTQLGYIPEVLRKIEKGQRATLYFHSKKDYEIILDELVLK